jgi:hypothetical protein
MLVFGGGGLCLCFLRRRPVLVFGGGLLSFVVLWLVVL